MTKRWGLIVAALGGDAGATLNGVAVGDNRTLEWSGVSGLGTISTAGARLWSPVRARLPSPHVPGYCPGAYSGEADHDSGTKAITVPE